MLNKQKLPNVNKGDYVYRYSWVHLMRPMTLTGTISPALTGTLLAAQHGTVRMDNFIAFLFAALLVQATVNMWNDYYDFQNGQDKEKWKRAGRDGKGPRYNKILIVTTLMVGMAVAIGLYITLHSSFWIAIVGVLGIVFGYAYSAGRNSLAANGLGELVAGIFLGPVVTTLAYAVQGNGLNSSILALSVPFSFLIASMILSNNIRDIEKDKAFRRTQAIILGRVKASFLLSLLLSLAYLWVFGLIYYEVVSRMASLSFFALPFAIRLCWSFRIQATKKDERDGVKWAAWYHWAFGLLFVLGLGLAQL